MKAMKVFGLLICAVALLGVLSAAAPLPPAPPAGGFSQMAYDSKAKLVILYGGMSGYWADPSSWKPETWTYDPVNKLWAKKSPAIHPASAHGGYMVYDSESDRTILSIPTNDPAPGTLLETWAYDLNNDAWELRTTGPMQTAGGLLLAYDAESDRTIMFGGMAMPEWQWLDETWAYDYNTNTWQKFDHHKKDGPAIRDFESLAYDEVADKIIMYGGYWFGNDETWVYDLNTDAWEQRLPATNPGPLAVYRMVYVKDINKTILFGGGDLGTYAFKTDTWSYDLGANTWSLVYPGQ